MERNNNTKIHDAQLLAKVYTMILSLHDPQQEETASPDDLGRDAGEAVQTTPTRVEGTL